MKTPLLACACMFAFEIVCAQVILNPSFEGTPRTSYSPPSWQNCHVLSTPDTQPGQWGVTTPASEGQTYLSLATRGYGGYINDGTVEDIFTVVDGSFKPNVCYKMAIDLAYSSSFNSLDLVFEPVRLEISIGDLCEYGSKVYTSPVIAHEDWKTYEFFFSVTVPSRDLILRALYPGHAVYGNVLVDNIRLESEVLTLGEDVAMCPGDTATLVASTGNLTVWSNGKTGAEQKVTVCGIYMAQFKREGCTISDTVQVVVKKTPVVDLGSDVSLCPQNSSVQFGPLVTPYHVLWSNGGATQYFSVTKPGTYWATIDNGCVVVGDTVVVTERNSCCEIEAPNVFTPNSDNLNDSFQVQTSSNILQYNLMIFDRWGKLAFSTRDISDSWNGSLPSDATAAPGVYYWKVNVSCVEKDLWTFSNEFKGSLQLIR